RIQNRVSALRRSSLGHGHGQAIGAGIDDSAPWKTEETIVGLPRLLVLSVFSRFGGCHLLHPRRRPPRTPAPGCSPRRESRGWRGGRRRGFWEARTRASKWREF